MSEFRSDSITHAARSFMFVRSALFGAFLVILTSSVATPVLAQPGQVLQLVSRTVQQPPAFDAGAAEVVAYDAASKTTMFCDAAANKISMYNTSNPSNPVFVRDILLAPYGGKVNSVAVKNGLVAVALEDALSKANPGKVVLFSLDGTFRSMVTVGALPDMLVFTPDGTKIVVCNEGEPLDNYTFDPEGSVSILTVTNPSVPTVQTVTFSALNGRQDSLRAMGIRIYGPGSSVAQDFEPEYAAITPDGRTAYVTLQENNALAVIDISSATLTRVVALGYKDYSRGLPSVTQYPWNDRPNLGTTAAGQTIQLGGFSGLWFEGYGADATRLRFLTHPDRGPNAEPSTLRGAPRRPFALPNYQAEVVRFELNTVTGAYTILDRVKLTRPDGVTPISGRPNLQAAGQGIAYTDEFGVDLLGNDIPNDPFGADLEGIVVAADGTWWLVDEYRPAIYHFLPNGTMAARYIPSGTAAAVGAAPGTYGTEALPAVYGQRRNNRGFEAVALEGDILYAFIQSPIDNPDVANDANSRASGFTRILAFNTVTKTVVGDYLYPMFETSFGCDKIGDAVSLGNGRFHVVERDDATGLRARKYIFEIDLKGATNLVVTPPTLPPGRTIESLRWNELSTYGIKPVYKMQAVYLPGAGYGDFDKVEGLAKIDDSTFALINDNDFGVGGSTLPSPPTGLITIDNSRIPVVGILKYNRPNGLDASDRDGPGNTAAINIRKWPVYGMYHPDAISVATVGGQTYIVSANEGDAREWGSFVEEVRVGSSSVVLDPAFAAAWPSLKTNAQLGRLNIVNNIGDIDGDGDFDKLFTLGARSFTIWNADGNLVWDSGSELEQRTAAFFPANFNTGHTTNAPDDRSDNKGPEPEAMAVGTINDSVYAFVGCERIGGIFMYNITDVRNPLYVDYINSRNFSVTPNLANSINQTVGDLGPETIVFVPAQESGNGGDLLLMGNEISGTLSIYNVRIPRILTTPPTTLARCIGDNLSLTVNATGVSLTYQWQKDGVNIPGATSATYSVPVTTSALAGSYRCLVTAAGGMTITTRPTAVTVAIRTEITRQPALLTQVDVTGYVELSLDATSTAGETFQWYKAGTALADGAKYSGTKSKVLSIRNLQFADTSARYYCIVTGGCVSVQSRNAAVYIPRALVTLQPRDTTVCPGDTIILRTAARGIGGEAGLAYRWRVFGGRFLTEGTRFRGTNTPTLRIIGARPEDAANYVCQLEGVPSGDFTNTNIAVVSVRTAPMLTVSGPSLQRDTIRYCREIPSILRVYADGAPSDIEFVRDGIVIQTGSSSTVALTGSGTYVVRVYGECRTAVAESRPFTVIEQARPIVQFGPSPVNVEEGDSFTLEFSLQQGTEELTYEWLKDGRILNGVVNRQYVVANARPSDAGLYSCRVSNSCGSTQTGTIRVSVVEEPTTSVNDEQSNTSIVRLYPQPAHDVVNFEITSQHGGSITIDILDLTGQVVAPRWTSTSTAGTQVFPLTVSLLPPGQYIVRVWVDGQHIVQPLFLAP